MGPCCFLSNEHLPYTVVLYIEIDYTTHYTTLHFPSRNLPDNTPDNRQVEEPGLLHPGFALSNTSLQHYTTALHFNITLQHYTRALHFNTTLQHYNTALHSNITLQHYTTTLHSNITLQHYTRALLFNTILLLYNTSVVLKCNT